MSEGPANDHETQFTSGDDGETTPHTKRFRAWGAAHEESSPSLWERLTGWLRGLFSRKKGVPPTTDSFSWETLGEQSAEAAGYKPMPRSSFDDLDAAWSDPLPASERRSSRPSAERPSVDDFQATWDGSYESDEEPVSAEIPAVRPPSPDADPLWDAPAVAVPSASVPPAFVADDLTEVWSPRDEPAANAPVDAPKRGFFAKLFGRNQEPSADAIADQERAAASDWAIDIAESSPGSEVEPADADFATDAAAATAPSGSDFGVESEAEIETDVEVPSTNPAPSIDHSAEDAARLAALLGPIVPAVDEEFEPEYETELPPEPNLDPVLETGTADDSNDPMPAVATAPEAEIYPIAEPDRKPGFFSSLLRRVSRSQFIPRTAVEPEPVFEEPHPAEIAATSDVADDIDDIEETVEVVEVEEVEDVMELDAAEAIDVDAPIEVDHSLRAVEPELASDSSFEATQPFPAFRDARDDFPESAETVTDSGRPTEQVDVPAFDEGDKTDEFEVIPATPDPEVDPADAETVGFFGRMFGRHDDVATEVSGDAGGDVAVASPPTVQEADGKVPFVLAKFRIFYNEIIRDKHQRSDVISGFATAIVSAGASEGTDPEFAAQLLSKRLSEMLELQAAESNWTGGDAAKYYLEAQYAMVALADETFATIDWPGRAFWHKHMLEPRMYGSRGADIEFFKRIDKLLKDNPEPPKGARDLARVYLLVIASGFRGKFRMPNVHRPLAEYRRRLFEFSHRVDPLDLYARDRRIFPEAVEHTLTSQAVGRFTSAQKWIAAALILAVLYLSVSHFAWSRLSVELKDVMSRIETTDTGAGSTR